jgi:hypothetical protein
VAPDPAGAIVISYLADWGGGHGGTAVLTTPPGYPFAVAHFVRNLAVRVSTAITGPAGAFVTFDVTLNGVEVPGFFITYGVGEPIGTRVLTVGPAFFPEGSLLDVRATAFHTTSLVDASATVGIE